jgi:hypothetical protein
VQARDAAGNVDPTPAEYTWEIDLTNPKMAWAERPGGFVRGVTNDSIPTWAYTFSDKNLMEGDPTCGLYDETRNKYVVTSQPCPSPTTLPFALADGDYSFYVWQDDKAYNKAYRIHYVEVDTVAPKVTSVKPTGTLVSPYTRATVTFNDDVFRSGGFVNIYKRGTNTPLAVYRYAYEDEEIEISPKNSLKRGTWYTVKVTTGVNDGANNLAAPKTWSFKTKG